MNIRFSAFAILIGGGIYIASPPIIAHDAKKPCAIASKPWSSPHVKENISRNVCYVGSASKYIKSIPIQESGETLIDLRKINNPRIIHLSKFDKRYKPNHTKYGFMRKTLYKKILQMLARLPTNIGIAYFEVLRPLSVQKEYFTNKFKELYKKTKDKEIAYQETAKRVSPFIDNIPPHATGAAIDMTLFKYEGKNKVLLDMGKFGTIFGPNNQEETFSQNTNKEQRDNRLLLLDTATQVGLVNYGKEWWHYSDGDKSWAFVKRKRVALYGLAINKADSILSIKKEDYLKGF